MSKFFISCLAASTLMFVSCKDAKSTAPVDESKAKITINHLSGTTDVVENPERIVVLNYGALDTFDELGVAVKGAPKTNLPSYLAKYGEDKNIVDVGGIKEPNFEKVNEVGPDLIVISARTAPLYDEFVKIGPTINLEVDTKSYMESFNETQRTIGKLVKKEEQVDAELKAIADRVNAIKEKTANSDKKALILLANEGKLSAFGPGSRFGIIHDVFGVPAVSEKIEESRHGQIVSNEYVKEANPDYIFVIDRGAAIKRTSLGKEEFSNALIKETNAYKNDKIIFLDAEIWYLAGGGLKSMKMMLDEIEGALAE